MNKKMKNVNQYKGIKSIVFFSVISIICAVYGSFLCAESQSFDIAYFSFAIIFLAIAIIFYIIIKINNSLIRKDMLKQHFATRCWRCNNAFAYDGNVIIKHNRHPEGYMLCPYCKQVLSHSSLNLIKYDGNNENTF